MTEGEFPFRSFTVRAEGYDRSEVDGYVNELQAEVLELRRARSGGNAAEADARLHDPEGAVTRTLAIAQETADRVLHDAQVEADQRRAQADEQGAQTLADAESRAAKMMADIETQTAEVRAQGIAAARSAIQVERDQAIAELGQIRRVRDDLRTEAVELKSVLETYARSASEASDVLGAAASGPLLPAELPDHVADDVALAGVVEDPAAPPELTSVDTGTTDSNQADTSDTDSLVWGGDDPVSDDDTASDYTASDDYIAGDDYTARDHTTGHDDIAGDDDTARDHTASDDDIAGAGRSGLTAVKSGGDAPLADVIAIDGDSADDDSADDDSADDDSADGDAGDGDSADDDAGDQATSGSSGAFLAEVRAAADEPVGLRPESEPGDDSDRFLTELRGVTDVVDLDDVEIDDEAADRFFDGD